VTDINILKRNIAMNFENKQSMGESNNFYGSKSSLKTPAPSGDDGFEG